jgi:hypothetical protein
MRFYSVLMRFYSVLMRFYSVLGPKHSKLTPRKWTSTGSVDITLSFDIAVIELIKQYLIKYYVRIEHTLVALGFVNEII